MGISFSSLLSPWKQVLTTTGLTEIMETMTVRSISFDKHKGGITLRTISFKNKENNTETTLKFDDSSNEVIIQEESMSFNKNDSNNKPKLNTTVSFKSLVLDNENVNISQRNDSELVHNKSKPTISLPEPAFNFSPHPVRQPTVSLPDPAFFFSPRPVSELDAAAVKLQKVYKSYRTRRNLADCAVVVEELWWKALDFADLKQSSISFFHTDKHETAVSRWSRARKRAAKVGKGLSKDEKAQKLALQHWLEAIDPRHRYGHNLHLYYDLWFESESTQPFFYWLDVGDGKEMNLEKCSRTNLQKQCIKYLGPKEREAYEVIVEDGKLVNKQTGILVNTVLGSKWIFVLSTSRSLYVGQKNKGLFQHSSFLAGGATTSAGRLVAHDGVLEAIWPYSGHYLPTEENFKEFISFLEEHHVDLTNVKRCAADEDDPAAGSSMKESKPETVDALTSSESSGNLKEAEVTKLSDVITAAIDQEQEKKDRKAANVEVPQPFEFNKRLSCKWSNGTGPRIGCVRDYPAELQFRALEQVNLSPRVTPGGFRNNCPIPSPRPSPKYRLSPRLAYMGIPSPRMSIPAAN